MKTSFAISVQQTDFGAIAKGDAGELVRHAKAIGYDAVELAVRDPGAVNVAELKSVLGDTPVSAIGTGQAFLGDGLSLTHKDINVRQAAIARLGFHCRLAADLGCGMVIIGLIRGRSGRHEYLVEGLREVCGLAAKAGVRLVVEPLNRYESELVATAADGLELIERVGAENLGLLLDTFHMNIEEPDPITAFRAGRNKLWHVHFADSNRLAPGWGHLDFQQIAGVLRDIGYDGYVSGEVIPQPDAKAAMDQTLEHMKYALTQSEEEQ